MQLTLTGKNSQKTKGYSIVDVMYLWKRFAAKKASIPNRQLTDAEIEELFTDLDRKRGVQ